MYKYLNRLLRHASEYGSAQPEIRDFHNLVGTITTTYANAEFDGTTVLFTANNGQKFSCVETKIDGCNTSATISLL